jgi:GTPase
VKGASRRAAEQVAAKLALIAVLKALPQESRKPKKTRSAKKKAAKKEVTEEQFEPQAEGLIVFRCGTIAIVGRPNMGKSTLLNALVGQKISITSRKAQTTRHRILGVQNREEAQFIFIDTPGFQTRLLNTLNKALNRTVTTALQDVNVACFVVEAGYFGEDDKKVLKLLPDDLPVVLVLNKLDLFNSRFQTPSERDQALLNLLKTWQSLGVN